jgi:hypothetical protein
MDPELTRGRLVRLALAGAGALLVGPRVARAAGARAARISSLAVRNVSRRYRGDRTLFATVSPGVAGRDAAVVSFELPRASTVRVEAVRTVKSAGTVQWTNQLELPAGAHEIEWQPSLATPVGSYVMRLSVNQSGGTARVLGARRPFRPEASRAPIVRVLGVEASFSQRSYAPGERAALTILADAAVLSLQFLRLGAETTPTNRNDELQGVPLGDPARLDWAGKRSAPATIDVDLGQWPTGLYAAQLTTDDGRVGFAPFIVRPTELGASRVAAVLPTNTWQAYNYYDADGDGWGDTWYAGGNPPVVLTRPFRDRGVPPKYRRYDLGFQKWLVWTGHTPDMLAEDDLEDIATGDDLRRTYDLVVFPGHTEYVTAHAYDVIQRFRDLGGRLIFLSANNFFWRVDRTGDELRRIKLWRALGRPEAALLGVQYRANDDGSRQAPYTVTDPALAPWLFEGTGLAAGSQFGTTIGGYGIEIDTTTPDSPPGTIVLAEIRDLFGPGYTAQMTYYETPAGARVFSAGVLDFGGSAAHWPQRRLLENLWRHMLADLPPLPLA